MAEYIDREYAKKMLDEYRISRTMSMYGDMDLLMEWRNGVECAMNKLNELPPADVVPKSEVERLQAEVDQLHALLECGVFANSVEDWQKFLNEKRAEDAREIFADFTKHKVCTNEEDFRVLAERKKKYEVGKDG